ncbi:MAG: glycosyltransferase family A protein [Gemmataceae bacterium]
MNPDDITVVVPTYKGRDHLSAALESVYAQTVRPREVIVVDDRSPDDTAAVARSLTPAAPVPVRVEVLARNSGGPARPLNVGVRLARTPWVAVLEQDDRMPPDRLALQAAAVREHPGCELSFGLVEVVGADAPPGLAEQFRADPLHPLAVPGVPGGPPAVRLPGDQLLWALVRRNVAVSNSNLLFSRSLWRRAGGFDESVKVVADLNFLLAASRLTDAAFVNRVCLRYTYSASSLCRTAGWDHEMQRVEYMRLRHPAACGRAEWWPRYWGWRAKAAAAARRGHLRTAARIGWLLLTSRAVVHHWRHRAEAADAR